MEGRTLFYFQCPLAADSRSREARETTCDPHPYLSSFSPPSDCETVFISPVLICFVQVWFPTPARGCLHAVCSLPPAVPTWKIPLAWKLWQTGKRAPCLILSKIDSPMVEIHPKRVSLWCHQKQGRILYRVGQRHRWFWDLPRWVKI